MQDLQALKVIALAMKVVRPTGELDQAEEMILWNNAVMMLAGELPQFYDGDADAGEFIQACGNYFTFPDTGMDS